VRGFLFADLRGYTAYVERAGDEAAASLLERYRSLVRGVVADHAGAEIRTEGDSFYVVFPSPSAAVRAGLELVERARADATDHPDAPISVGVGIHAGESAETAEGYVGSAVNLAARICSVAKAGEVLVSGTVRSLARTSLPVAFTPRGKPALKGLAEPVELYAVAPAAGYVAPATHRGLAAPSSTRARAGLVGIGAAAVVTAVVGIAALSGGSGGSSPSPSTAGSGGAVGSPGASASAGAGASAAVGSESPGVADFRQGPLDAGTYRTTVFQPGLELTVPDGWMGALEVPNAVVLGRRDDPVRERYSDLPPYDIGGRLSIVRPSIAASPCTPRLSLFQPLPSTYPRVAIPAGRDAFVEWAQNDPTLVLGSPTARQLGAFDVNAYDVDLSDDCDLSLAPLKAAEVLVHRDAAGFRIRYPIYANERTQWHVWDHEGDTMLAAIDTPEDFPEFEDAARNILTSLQLAE
jgi:class 3 adenylate cyclase